MLYVDRHAASGADRDFHIAVIQHHANRSDEPQSHVLDAEILEAFEIFAGCCRDEIDWLAKEPQSQDVVFGRLNSMNSLLCSPVPERPARSAASLRRMSLFPSLTPVFLALP
jgi:hypothetical protein